MTTVTAGNFQITKSYTIYTLSNGVGGAVTNFTLIGASANVIGKSFVATGAGTGTGSATLNEYGIKLYNKYGALIYDTSSVTWNQLEQIYVLKNESISRVYNYIVNKEVLVTQLFIDPPPLDRKAVACKILTNTTQNTMTINGYSIPSGGVKIYGGSENTLCWVLMR